MSRSHATTVSRWFVMPIPARSPPLAPAESSASLATARVTSQISRASCSTQPGRGKCWWNSRYARPAGRPRSSNTMHVVPVVPWSIARIKRAAAYPAGIFPAMPDVEAHITGTVWKIECEIGQSVEEGDTLVILESMKMEMPVEAEDGGTVKEIVCQEGQSVSEGDTLVVLE